MSEENVPEAKEVMPLLERLERCKSRESARKSISDYCGEIGVDPKDYKLSSEELFVFGALK